MMTTHWTMRPSRVLAKLRAGEWASTIKLNLADPRVAEIAARSGFDSVWLDMEHVPNDAGMVENMIRAARGFDVDAIVRVRRGSYSDHTLPLEMDATGIMVPHIMSLDDAKKVVHQTRFHPIGRRPWDGGNSDGGFCMVPAKDYIHNANTQRIVMVQIEDPEPMEELEAIAAVEGIDMLFFGPGDFSQGIGAPAQFDHPKIDEARRRIARVCRDAGKFAGTLCAPDRVPQFVDMGYQFLGIGADVVGMTKYFASQLSLAYPQASEPAADKGPRSVYAENTRK